MDVAQIPDPPPELMSNSVKCESYHHPSLASWQQPTKKKSRNLAEGYKCQVTVSESDEGRLIVRFHPSLGKEKACAMLRGGLESLSDSRHEAKTQKKGKQTAHASQPGSKRNGSSSLVSPVSMIVEAPNRAGSIPVMKRRRIDEHRVNNQTSMELSHEGKQLVTVSPSQGSNAHRNRLVAKNYPNTLDIRVDSQDQWKEWMSHAFKAVQQTGCRFLAKEWIRLIHPKKQSTHPYNGRRPRDVQASPERTKPPYWPLGVIHKEPDHISKEVRIELLIHLLMNTPQEEITIQCPDGGSGRKIVADDLLKTLDVKKPEIQHKMDIIREIINVRTDIESYNSGGVDGDMICTVTDFSDAPRKEKSTKLPAANPVNTNLSEPQAREMGDDAGMLSPTISSPTEADASLTDDEDEASLLNASFNSSMTQDSSATLALEFPSGARIPMKEDHRNNHGQAQDQHLVDLNTVACGGGIDFDQYRHAASRQQTLQATWPTPSGMVEPFADDPMLYASYGHPVPPDFFPATRSSAVHNVVPPTIDYHGNQHYPQYYMPDTYRPTSIDFSQVIDAANQGAGPGTYFKQLENQHLQSRR